MITCKEDLVNTYIENDNGVLRDVYVSLCNLHDQSRARRAGYYIHGYIGICHQWNDGRDIRQGSIKPDAKQLTLTDLLPTAYENTKVYSLDEDVIRKYAELCGVEYNYDTTHLSGEYVGISGVIEGSDEVARFTDDSDVHLGIYPTTTLTTEQILAAWDLKFNQSKLKTRTEYVKCHQSESIKAVMNGSTDYWCKSGRSYVHLNMDSPLEQFCRAYRRTEKEVTWQEVLAAKTGWSIDDINNYNGYFYHQEISFIEMCHIVASLTDKPE